MSHHRLCHHRPLYLLVRRPLEELRGQASLVRTRVRKVTRLCEIWRLIRHHCLAIALAQTAYLSFQLLLRTKRQTIERRPPRMMLPMAPKNQAGAGAPYWVQKKERRRREKRRKLRKRVREQRPSRGNLWTSLTIIHGWTFCRLLWMVDVVGKVWSSTGEILNLRRNARRRAPGKLQVETRKRRIMVYFLQSLAEQKRRLSANP